MALAELVRDYVHAHHAGLADQFNWALNAETLEQRLGLRVEGRTSYDRNIDLKVKLSELWARSELPVRQQIARYYVVDWGGVKRNSPETLNLYVSAVVTATVPPLPGIASWSKVFAAADPLTHAIFDARVALSLNALQVLDSANAEPELFPALPSQNWTVSAAGKSLQLRGRAVGWQCVSAAEVYPTYLRVLQHAADGLPGPLPLATAEMVLFAHAPQLALRVTQ